MKKFLIGFAGLLLIACNNQTGNNGEIKYSDLVASNLKGDVVSIEETPYKVDSTGVIGEMDSCCITITEYNENGNMIKSISKDSKGTTTRESVFTRHPNGLFKSVRTTEKGKNTGGFDTEIDDKGKFTRAWAVDSSGATDMYFTDITMNEVGEVTGWKRYDKDSVYRESGESQYDKHVFQGATMKDSVGTVKSHTSATYNDKGEQIEVANTNMNSDGSTKITITKYTYESHDENGNWTQRTEWDKDGKATKVVKRSITYKAKG